MLTAAREIQVWMTWLLTLFLLAGLKCRVPV